MTALTDERNSNNLFFLPNLACNESALWLKNETVVGTVKKRLCRPSEGAAYRLVQSLI